MIQCIDIIGSQPPTSFRESMSFTQSKISLLAPLLLALTSPTLLAAPPTAATQLSVAPAVELKHPTELGKFYTLQVKKGSGWSNVGHAIKGTGKPFVGLYPAGEYRIVSPTKKWVKVWSDEFDGSELDLTKWGKEENNYGGGNNERQAYRTEEKYCHVKDGFLNMSVYRDEHTTNDGKAQPYSSSRIRSLNRGDWTFGKFEIRAKMPSGQGIWPAVWMLPSKSKYGTWASGGEIDIIESRGSNIQETTGALHFGGPWPRNTHVAHSYQFPKDNTAEKFHTYALEWTADEIKWFVDGQLCQTRKKSEWFSEAARENPSAPFDQPFHLILNVAVDGRFFEKTSQKADLLAPSDFPQTLQVDYIRVFQWAP